MSRDGDVLALAAASKLTFPDLPMVACLGIAENTIRKPGAYGDDGPAWADQLQAVFTQAVAMGLLPPDYRPKDFDADPKANAPAIEVVSDPSWLDTIPGGQNRAQRRAARREGR